MWKEAARTRDSHGQATRTTALEAHARCSRAANPENALTTGEETEREAIKTRRKKWQAENTLRARQREGTFYMSEQQQPAPLAGRSLASSAAALWGLHNKWTAVTPSVGSPGDVPPTAKSYSRRVREHRVQQDSALPQGCRVEARECRATQSTKCTGQLTIPRVSNNPRQRTVPLRQPGAHQHNRTEV